jgi:hypothetical protein
MNTMFIVNAIISISLDVIFILFINSKGFELCWNMTGQDPDEFKEHAYKPINAIRNGMMVTIPILNAILLLAYLIGYIAFNKIKGS